MRRGSRRLAACGAAEEVKVGMVVRRSGGLTGGPRAILKASIPLRRPTRLLRQHRGRKAPSHSSGRRAPGRANASGLPSHLYVDAAKPQFKAPEASFSRGAHSGARRADCWRRLRILLSLSLATSRLKKHHDAARPLLTLGPNPGSTTLFNVGQIHGSEKRYRHRLRLPSLRKLTCGWDFLHGLSEDKL